MADVPFPLTATEGYDLKRQVWELIRTLYEDRIGGASLGDVFSIVGDVLTLALASASGLTKEGNLLAVDVTSDGGLQVSTLGLSIKIVSTGGLETTASGLQIKLDGDSLSTSASGIKINADLIDVSGLTASRILATNAAKKFVSITDLTSWIAGTANQITATSDGDGTLTLALVAKRTPAIYNIETHTTSQVLAVADLNKVHIFNSALDLTCTLPSVGADQLGYMVIMAKMGVGDLKIIAADTDTILDSSAGGSIECTDNTYEMPKMGLRLLTATEWHSGPDCFGVWSTR